MMSPRRRVYVFCKYPEPGMVKTRLAASIGADRAADIARELLCLTIERLESLAEDDIDLVLYVDPPHRAHDFESLVTDAWEVVRQPAGDLGTRLTLAFAGGNCDTIVVGSDCPDISARVLRSAFDRMGDQRMVFGPATDGGFYLLAARHVPPGFFQDIEWSSRNTLWQLRRRAENSGIEIALEPELYDVDTETDLSRWHSERRVDSRPKRVMESDQ